MNTDTNADKLVIIGAGGHGKVLAATALAAGRWAQIVFLDDVPRRRRHRTRPARFGRHTAFGHAPDSRRIPGRRGRGRQRRAAKAVRYRLKTLGFTLPDIVHPSAVVAPYAALGGGCAVFAQAVIQPGSRIGEGCIVNTAATVDHDCTLGAFVHISRERIWRAARRSAREAG
ncbi:hypothetical protein LVJ84_02955 [Kingella potus]|nr:hypothetical protein [Kingella potus]UOP01246.1 hypothetical protein LVJ84_02955 [Kingella potus]